MTGPELHTLAQVFTERLLNSAAEGMIVAGVAGLLLRLAGRQSASTRFAIWFSTLLAIVALPFFSGFAHSPVSAAHLQGGITLSSSWAFYLFAAWACIAGLLLIRLCVGLWRLRQFRDHCSDVNLAGLNPAAAEVLRDFGARNRVKLCVSSEVAAPSVIGFLRPAIIFPCWLLPQLSPEELKVILPHELAHLRRGDPWTNLAQKIVTALFFFHPAVWWIDNRLTLEREMACDDVVLAQSANPKAYASFLISFAEKLQNARGLQLAQALVTRMHQMSLRVAQILDAERPRHSGFWKPVLRLSTVLLLLVVGTAPFVPQFVAVRNQPQPQSQQDQTAKEEAQSVSPTENANSTIAAPVVLSPTFAKKIRAIPAVFTPRAAAIPLRRARVPGKALTMRAKAVPAKPPVPEETFFIVQTTQYDSSGPRVWTLCIWTVKGGTLAAKPLESAIFLSI